jgi:hypothetical protein
VLCHLGPQQFEVVFEGTLPAACVGLCRTASAPAPALPEFLDKRAADTKALRYRPLRLCPGFQRRNNSITKVLRVWFHTWDYTENAPYKQLQPALVAVRSTKMAPHDAQELYAVSALRSNGILLCAATAPRASVKSANGTCYPPHHGRLRVRQHSRNDFLLVGSFGVSKGRLHTFLTVMRRKTHG